MYEYDLILASQYYKPHIGGVENSIYYLAKAAKNQGFNPLISYGKAPVFPRAS